MAHDTIEASPFPPQPPLRMTYEEFLDYDFEEGLRVEWVDGEVEYMGEISDAHNLTGWFIIRLLSEWAEATDAGEVKYEPFNMKLGGRRGGRSPDVLFIKKENLHRKRRKNLDGPADVVVEIVSDDSSHRDRVVKFREYEGGGVPEYWILDPEQEEAEFYVLNANGVYVRAEPDADGRFFSTALPGLWLEVAWLWERPLPPMRSVRAAWETP